MELIKKFFSKIDANHKYKLGLEEHRKGRIENSIEMFSKAIDKYEEHLPSLFARGQLYIDIVRWDKAILDLKKVKSLDPDFENIDFLIGICSCALGDMEKGLNLLDSQITKTPKRPEPYWNRAIAYKNIGENEKALNDINKAIDILRRNYKLYCIKAEILEDLDRKQEAEKCYDKAIEIEKDPGESLLNKIGYFKRNGKIEPAITGMDELIKRYPFDGHLFLKRGELKQLKGAIESAKEDFTSALNNGAMEAKEKLKNIA